MLSVSRQTHVLTGTRKGDLREIEERKSINKYKDRDRSFVWGHNWVSSEARHCGKCMETCLFRIRASDTKIFLIGLFCLFFRLLFVPFSFLFSPSPFFHSFLLPSSSLFLPFYLVSLPLVSSCLPSVFLYSFLVFHLLTFMSFFPSFLPSFFIFMSIFLSSFLYSSFLISLFHPFLVSF
jgi:hypothetical protein